MPFGHQSLGSSTRSTTSPWSSTVPRPSSSRTVGRTGGDGFRSLAARCPDGSSVGRSPSRSPCGSCARGPCSSGRLAARSQERMDDDGERVLSVVELDLERCERTLVLRDSPRRRRRRSRCGRHPRTGSRRDPPPPAVEPRPLRHPLEKPAVPPVIGSGTSPARHRSSITLPGTRAGNQPGASHGFSRCQRHSPPRNPRSCQPCRASAPLEQVCLDHVLGRSAWTRNVLISLAPSSVSIVRPTRGSSILACAGRPADS